MNEKTQKTNHSPVSSAYLEQGDCYAALGKEGLTAQDSRVSIHVHSIRKRLCDADGISAKAVIDGIVAAGLLPDDSPEFVKEVSYSQEKGEEEITIIEIWE